MSGVNKSIKACMFLIGNVFRSLKCLSTVSFFTALANWASQCWYQIGPWLLCGLGWRIEIQWQMVSSIAQKQWAWDSIGYEIVNARNNSEYIGDQECKLLDKTPSSKASQKILNEFLSTPMIMPDARYAPPRTSRENAHVLNSSSRVRNRI